VFGETALILDKSAFQALSRDEHLERSITYLENIPPVLLREILADLAKTDVKGGPEQLVRTLASKFLGSGGVINADYRKLCQASLHGERISMEGRPVIDDFTEVQEPNGSTSVLIEPGEGNRAILRWASAEFGPQERWLAAEMRRSAQSFSLDALRGRLRAHRVLLPRPKEVGDLRSIADELLATAALKVPLVDWLAEQLALAAPVHHTVVTGWQKSDATLSRAAPYACHCIRVLLMLLVGMTHKLLSARPTNRIDAEYLFYLPFCSVFVSDDKLHRQLTPALLRDDQRFAAFRDFRDELARRSVERKTRVTGSAG